MIELNFDSNFLSFSTKCTLLVYSTAQRPCTIRELTHVQECSHLLFITILLRGLITIAAGSVFKLKPLPNQYMLLILEWISYVLFVSRAALLYSLKFRTRHQASVEH